MNPKVLIPVLVLTHAGAGIAGFFIARSLATDPDHKKQDKELVQKLDSLDDAGQTTPKAPTTDATPGPEAAPADFKPGKVTFSLVSRGMSRVAFTSDAPIESIVGTSTNVSGDITVDTGSVSGSSATDIKVAVNSLKTGNDTRDEHLQGEQWFDAKGHPDILFKLESVEADDGRLWPGRTIDAKVKGTLTIKGISQPVETTASVAYYKWNPKLADFGVKTNLLRLKADFNVKLSDFKMEAGVVGQKVAEVVVVSLNLTATENPPAE